MELKDKREVIFLIRQDGESKEEFAIRIAKVIEEKKEEGLELISSERKGNGIILTFES